MKIVTGLCATTILSSTAAFACSTCFGDPDHAQTQGMNMAILTLLGVTGTVVGTIVAFGATIALRMRRAERAAAGLDPY